MANTPHKAGQLYGSEVLVKRGLPRKKLSGPAGYRQSFRSTLSEALPQELRGRAEARKSERMTFYDWAMQVPEPKAGKLDWHRFPFQRELYEQEVAKAASIVIKKPTQVGISAYLLRWALYWADMRAATALYVFPKLKQMYDFSDARVRASINASPYLKSRIPAHYTQNKGLKQVGYGYCYFRGSESEDDLDSVDADVLALDEYDRLHPPNVPVAERRISGPRSMGLQRRVGVPTIPSFGISKLFSESDMRRWFVKCGRCGEQQSLNWQDNVDAEAAARVCKKCRKPLEPDAIRNGEWVASYPSRDVRGYHMNKLIVPDATANAVRNLVANSEKTLPEDRQAFWNRDMGEAYAPEEGRLSNEAIAAACTAGGAAGAGVAVDVAPHFNLVTMGVDVASSRALHVRVSEHLEGRRKRSIFLGTVNDYDALDALMKRYGVHMCAIDHLPEGRLSRAFADRWAGQVYLVAYTTTAEKVIRVNDDTRMTTVRRTDAIDATLDLVRQQRNLLPPVLPDKYAEHMQALIRVAEKDPSGRKKVRYESTGADDYAHAEVYDLVASELFWMRQSVENFNLDELTLLEQHMDFERSVLREAEDIYVSGPDDGYDPGLGRYE